MEKVLIVDDSRISRNLIEKIFVELDYEVVDKAVDGIDGFEKFKLLKPDFITIDIEMPKLDGIGLMKLIKEYDNKVKVIIISSTVNSQIIQEVIRLGAFVVKKPLKKERLLNAIKLLDR